MSNTPRELPMSLGFYEVLNGEFKPSCDLEGDKTHTLSRLVMATIEKGEDVSKGKKEYKPSWAREFTAEVVLTPAEGLNNTRQVLWLGLHGPHRDLSFTHDRSGELVVVTSSGIKAVEAEFELPASVRENGLWPQSRVLATDVAELFFDISHQAQ